MNNIDKYKAARQEYLTAKSFLSLMGKPGHCGEGHLHSVSVSGLQIYHQQSAGANNYHDASPAFLRALEVAIAKSFDELSKKALDGLERNANFHKDAAQSEFKSLFGEVLALEAA